MEYLEGRTLKELIVARGPLPIADAIAATRQILGALRFAHRKGIVHRDIKPHNVLVDGDGRLKVTDFGIARAGASQMTEAGSIIGTAQYLSPEQARGAPVDQRSDLYSVGIVLYEMLTGAVPFTGDTPGRDRDEAHLGGAAAAVGAAPGRAAGPRHGRAARAGEGPGERFQTAEEMDAELGRVAAGARRDRGDRRRGDGGALGRRGPTPLRPRSSRRAAPPPYAPPGGYRLRRAAAAAPLGLALAARAAPRRRRRHRRLVYAYERIQDELNGTSRSRSRSSGACGRPSPSNILDRKGLEPNVHPAPNETVKNGIVNDQKPEAGERDRARATIVTIYVSPGTPKVDVPDVKGERGATRSQRSRTRG